MKCLSRFHNYGPCSHLYGCRRALTTTQPFTARDTVTTTNDVLPSSSNPFITPVRPPLPNLTITTYHALPSDHQRQLDYLGETIRRTKEAKKEIPVELPNRALVACSLLSGECHCSSTPPPQPRQFLGVNHAFHTLVNGSHGTLKGILKGCAEQNALGAFAAHGLSYVEVDRIYLVAASLSSTGSASPLEKEKQPLSIKTVPFPCRECWDKFIQISAVRTTKNAPPLELFVRCLPEEERILQITETAKAHARSQPSIRITLVLDEILKYPSTSLDNEFTAQ